MNKTELVTAVSEQAGVLKKDTEAVIKATIDVISKQLQAGDSVQLVGFGTFSVAERAARTGKNPLTGEPIKISAAKAPRFKAGKALKDLVNNK